MSTDTRVGLSQSLGVSRGSDLPVWLERWSALSERADLPRRLPGSGPAFPQLNWPAPKAGLFWQGGNPAGLPDEMADRRADFWAASGEQQGQFRRPLDPGASRLAQLAAIAWQPLGSRGAGIGRVSFDRETIDPGTQSNVSDPFGSSPFVTIDTSSTPVRRTRARLEAAGGWRLGRFRAGATLGYDTRDQATLSAGFVRRGRQVMPGATLGIARSIGSGEAAPRVGASVGWRGSAETVLLTERGAEGRVYQLVGYRDVRSIDVSSFYYRRIEMSEPVAALQATGTLRGTRWVVFADAARLDQRLWREEASDPASDRWTARAWSAGLVVERTSANQEWVVTGSGQYRTLEGNADLARDSTGTVFAADERASSGTVEVRWTPARPWRALASVSVPGERRRRRDLTAGIDSDLEGRTPLVTAEGAWKATTKIELLAALAYGRYQVRGYIPQAVGRGLVYRRFLAPELQLQSTESSPRSIALSARWHLGRGATLWALTRSESLSGGPLSTATSGPSSRRATSVVVGASR